MQVLFCGVPIYTLWDKKPMAEAMVVDNGNISAVGDKRELAAQFPKARKVSLDGGAVIPAFNDSHAHILSSGLALTRADLRGCPSFSEMETRRQEWIAKGNQKGWIFGIGYDQNLLPERKHVTRYDLDRRVMAAHRGGWQIGVHAIGDQAVELTVQAYEKAQTAFPRQDPRHRVEHCFFTDAEMVRKMARFGIIAAVQPEFLYHLSHYYRPALGARTDRGMPIRTWLQAGVAVAFSSTQPVVPGDPIIGWRAAVNRKHKTGFAVASEEGLDPLTALKCFTVGSAHAIFDEAVGTLAPGKKADFAVLSHPPEKILDEDMKVATTSAFLL